jgi:hypothetical protein
MSDDLIRRQADYDFFPPGDVNREEFFNLQEAKLAFYGPSERVAAIHAIDECIDAADGGLREVSQLVRLRRRMSDTHENLLRIKR